MRRFLQSSLLFVFLVPLLAFSAERIAPPIAELTQNFKPTKEEMAFGATVLYKKVEEKVTEDGKSSDNYYVAIKVLNKKAVNDYGQFTIRYNGYYEDIDLAFARIITSSGESIDINADATQTQTGGLDRFFDNTKQLKFSLPALSPGAIIEYQYSSTTKKVTIPNQWMTSRQFHFIQRIPNSDWIRSDPIRQSIYSLELPSTMQLKIHSDNMPVKPEISLNENYKTYSWELKNIAGIEIEPAMPKLDEFLSRLDLSTLNSWTDIAKWSNSQVEPKIESTEKLKQLAESLTANKTTTRAKAQAIFNYIQENIKYVYAHVDANGYTPHPASEVLTNKYGDCKDQTILAVSLLRIIGIDAHAALISTYQETFDSKTPILAFDHMIVHIPDATDYKWWDTSGNTGRFPGIYPSLYDSTALVVSDNGQLTPLNISNKGKNNINYAETVSYDEESHKRTRALKINLTGSYDTNLRSWYKSSQDKENDLYQLFAYFMGDNSELLNTHTSDVDDLDKPFQVSATLLDTLDTSENTLYVYSDINSLLKTFTGLMALPLPQQRHHDFVFSPNYQITSTVSYKAPLIKSRTEILRTGTNYDTPFFSLSYEADIEQNEAVLKSIFKQKQQRVAVADYKQYYQTINNAFKQTSSLLSIADTDDKPVINNAATPIEQVLSKAQKALDDADFVQAKVLANKAITLDDSSGLAYYILGVSSGLLDDYDASDKYLEKAELLGYEQ